MPNDTINPLYVNPVNLPKTTLDASSLKRHSALFKMVETIVNKNTTPRFLGPMTLALLSAAAIISLRNLPSTALLGSQSIFFFAAAAFFFFIPVALACAELASGWPEEGGVYLWVKEAFGPRMGFLATWLQWAESVAWLPLVLSFLAATTAYLFQSTLGQNKYFLTGFMLLYLWGATLLNFRGLQTSSWVSILGVALGTLLPGILLIGLAYYRVVMHPESEMLDFSISALFPTPRLESLVLFSNILLGLCGMEVAAYYVRYAKRPQRDYPLAVLLATLMIVGISILGSLAIAAIVPKSEISLVAGPMQAFELFFKHLHMPWISPFLAALTLIGGIALLNTWVMGPNQGLLATAKDAYLPAFFKRTNNKNAPTALLAVQAIIATLLTSVFILHPSIKAAFWILTTLAAQLYAIMYCILFLALIKLRYSKSHIPRAYKIPGGLLGVWIVGGIGIIGTASAFLIGMILPPAEEIPIQISALQYVGILSIGILVFILPPLVCRPGKDM